MIDLTTTVAPKSDQLNADDLIGGPRTIRITRVVACSEPEQPIAIHFEGDGGKPYKPGKSMRRVLIHVWGGDGNAYVGRSMTLYRDPSVQFGGLVVGGIRISHMSDITRDVAMALTATRGAKKAYKVQPLRVEPATDTAAEVVAALIARIEAAENAEALQAITEAESVVKQRTWLAAKRPELSEKLDAAIADRQDAVAQTEEAA